VNRIIASALFLAATAAAVACAAAIASGGAYADIPTMLSFNPAAGALWQAT
jgi:hypothetical protein